LGLFFASNLAQNKNIKNILLIVGDTISKHLDLNDRSTASPKSDAVSDTLIKKKIIKATVGLEVMVMDMII
jgi:3-oxoacyl-[acyl-carrier-protein] synthase III